MQIHIQDPLPGNETLGFPASSPISESHQKIYLLFLLCTMAVYTSCSAQNASRETNHVLGGQLSVPIAFGTRGDTVKEPGSNIMTVYQDKKNIYWFGSWQDGLYRYDPSPGAGSKPILHYTTKSGLPHHRVEDIQEDKWGNVFFNTPGGVCKFDGQTFTLLPVKENGEWKLKPGDLWFKSLQFSGKVYRYDGKVLHRLQFPGSKLGEDWISKHPAYSNPYGIYTIYKDSKGNVWFGTAALGACRYNGKSFDWISEDDVTELHDRPANGVRSIIEDRDGYFWFNSAYRYDVYGNHPSINNLQKQPFYSREKNIGSLDGIKDGDLVEYMSIVKDNNNELWIATYIHGVWRYDGKNIKHYPVQNEGKDITLFSINKDNKGDLWLGTHANGAFKFNGTTFERFKP